MKVIFNNMNNAWGISGLLSLLAHAGLATWVLSSSAATPQISRLQDEMVWIDVGASSAALSRPAQPQRASKPAEGKTVDSVTLQSESELLVPAAEENHASEHSAQVNTQAVAALANTGQQASQPSLALGLNTAAVTRDYLGLLAQWFGRSVAYPSQARRARVQGTVYVVLTIDAQGQVLAARLERSSGHSVLDDAALQVLRTVRNVPRPPAALGWRSRHAVTIPIIYRLA
jgi:protein TonB